MSAVIRVIVLGSINTDLVVKGPRLPAPGETVTGGEFYEADGGKGANQAVAAARAGSQPAAFIAALGDDSRGRAALDRLKAEKLDCGNIKIVAGHATGVALIFVDDEGQNMISVASGANATLTAADVAAIPEEMFAGARVFLACLETPLDAVLCGLRRARQAGLTTILNPAPAAAHLRHADWLSLVDILTPNAVEAATLAGTPPPRNFDEAARTARGLQGCGCGSVVLTLGKAGCLVVSADVTQIAAHHVRAIDATAAGDAFNGALAAALAENLALVDAARWANAAAAVSVTRRGAQPSLPTRAEIEQMLAPPPA